MNEAEQKRALLRGIFRSIERLRMNNKEAAHFLGVSPPRLENIRLGRDPRTTLEMLENWYAQLGGE